MPIPDPKRFGTDLRLLRNLDLIKSNRDPGNDLGTTRRRLTGEEEFDRRSGAATQVDLGTFDGSDNLVQALLLRFLTPMGELSPLGHPDYGCRLAELVGELNSETNRNRAKLFVLQALALEPRVKQVLSVDVLQNKKDPVQIDIKLSLLVVDRSSPLNLVFPFFLERGVIP
jgi:phage baseplate assembly protein W